MDKDRILALDTETTGVGPNAEILQLSVIDESIFPSEEKLVMARSRESEPHLPCHGQQMSLHPRP